MQQEYYTKWSTIILNFSRSEAVVEKNVIRLVSMMYYIRGNEVHITDGNNFVAKTPCEDLETIATSWPSYPKGVVGTGRKLYKWLTEAHEQTLKNPIYPPHFIINIVCHTIFSRRYQSQVNRIGFFEDPILSGFLNQNDDENPLHGYTTIPYRRFNHKGMEFPTCTETSLFNLMNFFSRFGLEAVGPTITVEFYAWIQGKDGFVYKHDGCELRGIKENLLQFLSLYNVEDFVFEDLGTGTKIYHKSYPEHFGIYTYSGHHSDFIVKLEKIKFDVANPEHKYASALDFYVFNTTAPKTCKHRWVLTGYEE